MEPLRYYANRFGQFANRFLDGVLMGQTAPGSYIVSAFVPVVGYVPLSQSGSGERRAERLNPAWDSAPTREITLAVIRAVETTLEAVSHYRETTSYAGFDEGVARGVSFEMTSALRMLVEGGDGADVTVEWNLAAPPPGAPGWSATSWPQETRRYLAEPRYG